MDPITKIVDMQHEPFKQTTSIPSSPTFIPDSQSSTPICSQSDRVEYVLMPPQSPILPANPTTPAQHDPEALILTTPPSRMMANPAPLGLSAFALTAFLSSMMNLRLGVSIAAENVASGLIYAGAVQLIAGIW